MVEKQARVVIIGGGIIGCSIAYHLAEKGETNVVVVERLPTVGGWETERSAAMLMHQTDSLDLSRLAKESIPEYKKIFTENHLGFHQEGSILYSTNKERGVQIIKERISWQSSLEIESILFTASEITKYVPFVNVDDIVAGCYCPEDGHIDPHSAVMFYFEQAKDAGVRFYTGLEAYPIVRDGKISEVVLNQAGTERIETEFVVNAAGGMAPFIGQKIGIVIPIETNVRYVSIVKPVPSVTQEFPIMKDLDDPIIDPQRGGWYFRPDAGGTILVGEGPVRNYEIRNDNKDSYPSDNNQDAKDRLAEYIALRLPELMNSTPITNWPGIRSISKNGVGLPILGGVDWINGYVNCCGMSGLGITIAPACGKLIAELIIKGNTSIPLEPFLLRSRTGGP